MSRKHSKAWNANDPDKKKQQWNSVSKDHVFTKELGTKYSGIQNQMTWWEDKQYNASNQLLKYITDKHYILKNGNNINS